MHPTGQTLQDNILFFSYRATKLHNSCSIGQYMLCDDISDRLYAGNTVPSNRHCRVIHYLPGKRRLCCPVSVSCPRPAGPPSSPTTSPGRPARPTVHRSGRSSFFTGIQAYKIECLCTIMKWILYKFPCRVDCTLCTHVYIMYTVVPPSS